MSEKIAVLIGGSDLFSGLRGVSKGTKLIHKEIADYVDDVIIVNYNYFLDFGNAVKQLFNHLSHKKSDTRIILYGYSKGGDIAMQLSRKLQSIVSIELLITIDIANGPWSNKVNRVVAPNVKKNINVYQSAPNFPLRSYGMQTSASDSKTIIENIDLTGKIISGIKVTHSSIENLQVTQVASWIKDEAKPVEQNI